jgi:hypothetical protein
MQDAVQNSATYGNALGCHGGHPTLCDCFLCPALSRLMNYLPIDPEKRVAASGLHPRALALQETDSKNRLKLRIHVFTNYASQCLVSFYHSFLDEKLCD